MRVIGHGVAKFPTGKLLESSIERSWTGIFAERRSHPAGVIPTFSPTHTEVAILIRGRSTVTRQADGVYQRTAATRGTIWVCPAGLKEDFIVISDDIAEVLHLYLPANPFAALATATESAPMAAARLRYCAGFHDPLIEQIAQLISMEMNAETSSGKLFVESLACSLAARLLHTYSNVSVQRPCAHTTRIRLDRRRLQRVLEFIDAHIEDDLSVATLASTACLSQFHFARVFKTATGESPHQYVSARRLEHAKVLLAQTDRTLTDISLACRFSSQGNFSRAFRRATGFPPGRYRAEPGTIPDEPRALRFESDPAPVVAAMKGSR
jgi:AraC family transcriptional regulator